MTYTAWSDKYLFDVITVFYIHFCILPPFSRIKAQFVAKRSYRFKLCFNKARRRKETKYVKEKGMLMFFTYYFYFNIYSSGVCVMK